MKSMAHNDIFFPSGHIAHAIEHQYIPWLELAASLPYTGAKAARLALQAIRLNVTHSCPKNHGRHHESSTARLGG